jgi:hypothetical protein
MEHSKSTFRRAWIWRASALGALASAAAIWGSGGCTALLNIDRFSVAQPGSSDSGSVGGEGGATPLYSDLVFTLQGMFPHQTHYFEYRIVSIASNSVIARGAAENCGLGTISNSGVDVPLTAPKAIPSMGTGPLRLDFFAETSDDNHLFDEPDYNLSSESDAALSPNFLIKDHSWQVAPLVDTLIYGPLPDGGTTLPHEEGKVQIYFIHNPNTVDIDIDAITGKSNPPVGVGGDVTFSLSNLDTYANDLLELRVYNSSYVDGPTTSLGSPTGNVGLYRFPVLNASLGGGFKGLPALTRGKGSSFPGIAGIISAGTNYIVDVYIDANGNGIYDDPATNGGDLGWRMRMTSDASGNLTIAFDPTKNPNSSNDVGPP